MHLLCCLLQEAPSAPSTLLPPSSPSLLLRPNRSTISSTARRNASTFSVGVRGSCVRGRGRGWG
jgi:hypothetical protein